MKVHTKKRMFKCNECTRKFTTKWVRDQHLKTHANIDQFNCNICSFMSNSSYNLEQHYMGNMAGVGSPPAATDFCGNHQYRITKKCTDCMKAHDKTS